MARPIDEEMVTMQFLVSVIADDTALASADEAAAIDTFHERTKQHWVLAGGLAAPSSATVIDNRGAEPVITEGPFIETAEWLAGFWVFEVPDREAALALATEGSRACNRRVEVRALL